MVLILASFFFKKMKINILPCTAEVLGDEPQAPLLNCCCSVCVIEKVTIFLEREPSVLLSGDQRRLPWQITGFFYPSKCQG